MDAYEKGLDGNLKQAAALFTYVRSSTMCLFVIGEAIFEMGLSWSIQQTNLLRFLSGEGPPKNTHIYHRNLLAICEGVCESPWANHRRAHDDPKGSPNKAIVLVMTSTNYC